MTYLTPEFLDKVIAILWRAVQAATLFVLFLLVCWCVIDIVMDFLEFMMKSS